MLGGAPPGVALALRLGLLWREPDVAGRPADTLIYSH